MPKMCTGAGQYAFTGSVVFEDEANTGECPECATRQACSLDGIVLAHELKHDPVAEWRKRSPRGILAVLSRSHVFPQLLQYLMLAVTPLSPAVS